MTRELRRLVWDLFIRLRALEPPSAGNTAWQNEWAKRFHELEAEDAGPAPMPTPEASREPEELAQPDADAVDDDVHDEGRGAPVRSRSAPKRRR
jgi:hypothetical protein